MTTGRINQVTGLGPDHDIDASRSRRACTGPTEELQKVAISEALPKKRSWRKPSHTSLATPEVLVANRS